MSEHFDRGSLIIIITTFILFTIALFTKGLANDLLLEAGVLLVSIKLILMAYKNSVNKKDITKELRDIRNLLEKKED